MVSALVRVDEFDKIQERILPPCGFDLLKDSLPWHIQPLPD